MDEKKTLALKWDIERRLSALSSRDIALWQSCTKGFFVFAFLNMVVCMFLVGLTPRDSKWINCDTLWFPLTLLILDWIGIAVFHWWKAKELLAVQDQYARLKEDLLAVATFFDLYSTLGAEDGSEFRLNPANLTDIQRRNVHPGVYETIAPQDFATQVTFTDMWQDLRGTRKSGYWIQQFRVLWLPILANLALTGFAAYSVYKMVCVDSP